MSASPVGPSTERWSCSYRPRSTCALPEAGGARTPRRASRPPAPAALDAKSGDEVGRRRELPGKRVAERVEVLQDAGLAALGRVGERADQRPEEQPEQPPVQRSVFDAGVVPLREVVAAREREQQPGDKGGRVRLRVGVVDDDELLL